MTYCLLRTLMFAAIAAPGGMAYGNEQPDSQKSAYLSTQVEVQMSYLLYFPKDYEQQESWPLLLFLHGSGERGDDLELVKMHGPPKLIAAGQEFPFIVVSPQCQKDRLWEPIELVALLDDLSNKYKVDHDRICVTGLSMGGFGAWQLASYAPDRLAAIVPICGGGEKHWARQFAHLPVWAFHGAKDTGVPLERSQVMVDELKKHGGNPKLTVYPEAGHDSWSETYDNPELYKWLLGQKRVARDLTSLKGWELYVWEEDAQPHFSLMAGTNRLKSAEEIAKSAVKGVDAIRTKLDQLKKGDAVFLHGRRLDDQAPAKPGKLVTEYCKKIGLKTP